MQLRTIDLGHEQLLIIEGQRGADCEVFLGGVRLKPGGAAGRMPASSEEVAIVARQQALYASAGAAWIDCRSAHVGSLLRKLAALLRRWSSFAAPQRV